MLLPETKRITAIIIKPCLKNRSFLIRKAQIFYIEMKYMSGGWFYDDNAEKEIFLADALDMEPDLFLFYDFGELRKIDWKRIGTRGSELGQEIYVKFHFGNYDVNVGQIIKEEKKEAV